MRARLALLPALAATVAALAVPAGAPAARVPTTKFFRTPSHLISCVYLTRPATLRCDTRYRTRYSARHEHCAQGDYTGQVFTMTRRGRPHPICASDSAMDPHARVLRYGHTRRLGPFRCTSRSSALTCRNAAGHGWVLSKRHQRLF